jgi:hypothetical protein
MRRNRRIPNSRILINEVASIFRAPLPRPLDASQKSSEWKRELENGLLSGVVCESFDFSASWRMRSGLTLICMTSSLSAVNERMRENEVENRPVEPQNIEQTNKKS